jgi:hypothetical protein
VELAAMLEPAQRMQVVFLEEVFLAKSKLPIQVPLLEEIDMVCYLQ